MEQLLQALHKPPPIVPIGHHARTSPFRQGVRPAAFVYLSEGLPLPRRTGGGHGRSRVILSLCRCILARSARRWPGGLPGDPAGVITRQQEGNAVPGFLLFTERTPS
jgi:hypothetical protein